MKPPQAEVEDGEGLSRYFGFSKVRLSKRETQVSTISIIVQTC